MYIMAEWWSTNKIPKIYKHIGAQAEKLQAWKSS